MRAYDSMNIILVPHSAAAVNQSESAQLFVLALWCWWGFASDWAVSYKISAYLDRQPEHVNLSISATATLLTNERQEIEQTA